MQEERGQPEGQCSGRGGRQAASRGGRARGRAGRARGRAGTSAKAVATTVHAEASTKAVAEEGPHTEEYSAWLAASARPLSVPTVNVGKATRADGTVLEGEFVEGKEEKREEQEEQQQRRQPQAEKSWKRLALHATTLPTGSSERWEANLAALRVYVEEHGGRFPSQSSARAEENGLGTWCCAQRSAQRGTWGVISAAQVRLLEQVRGWSERWEANRVSAETLDRVARGVCFCESGGTCLICVRAREGFGPNSADWLTAPEPEGDSDVCLTAGWRTAIDPDTDACIYYDPNDVERRFAKSDEKLDLSACNPSWYAEDPVRTERAEEEDADPPPDVGEYERRVDFALAKETWYKRHALAPLPSDPEQANVVYDNATRNYRARARDGAGDKAHGYTRGTPNRRKKRGGARGGRRKPKAL